MVFPIPPPIVDSVTLPMIFPCPHKIEKVQALLLVGQVYSHTAVLHLPQSSVSS